MLADTANALIAAVRDESSTEADVNAAAQSFFKAAAGASREDANDALRTLSAHFDLEDASRAAFLALVCGAFIERGCDPQAISQPLTERLASLLESSAALASACIADMPAPEDQLEGSEGADEDRIERFERSRRRLIPAMAEHNAGWEALKRFWVPAIAVYSASAESRAAARRLRDLAAQVAEYHEGGHWLRLMLAVLDDEPIMVIEPQATAGILGRISGVVDNFQLNVLLMDGFPKSGFLARRRVPRRVADVARGIGPQRTGDTVTGVWNMYTWRAIEAGFALPDPGDYASSECWIWNEGTPEDIPVFEGRRAILLGPASYPRSWQSQRMFNNLRAKLEVERRLTRDEIHDWLRRMLAAKTAS